MRFPRWTFSLIFIAMFGLNIATHVLTRHAPAVDGFHAIGFPFAFHRCGGECHVEVCDSREFDAGYFAADIAIALCVALVAAMIAAFIAGRIGRRGAQAVSAGNE